jgi:hypothetical protein
MAGRHGGGNRARPQETSYGEYQQTGYQQTAYGPAQCQIPQYAPPQPQGYSVPPQQQGYSAPLAPLPRKKRRVFMWVFFAVQALFLVWLISGLVATGHTAPSQAQMLQYCGTGPKSVLALYASKADCMNHYSQVLSDASGVGRGLGVAFVVAIWIVVDFLLGLGYGIYRLATRSR